MKQRILRIIPLWVVACLVAGQFTALLIVWQGSAPYPRLLLFRGFVGLVIGLWLTFCVQTLRRMGEWRRDAQLGRVYRLGVMRWGMMMWITMSICIAAQSAGFAALLTPLGALRMLLQALFTFPFYVWAGYLLGRTMAAAFPRRCHPERP